MCFRRLPLMEIRRGLRSAPDHPTQSPAVEPPTHQPPPTPLPSHTPFAHCTCRTQVLTQLHDATNAWSRAIGQQLTATRSLPNLGRAVTL